MSSNKKIKTKKSNTSSSNPQKVPSFKKKKKYIRRRKTKTRTKTKPHKYVSLREVELLESSISQDSKEIMKKDDQDNNHQLNLFPLHPQNLIEEKEDQDHQDNIMVDFFNNTYGGETLTSLLWGGGNNDNSTHDEKCSSNHQEDSYLSPTITYRHDGEGGESSDLMRSALRHREREKDGNEDHEEEKEEKWVSYEEVLVIENNKKKKKKKESMEEEVISGSRLFNSQDHQKQSMKRVLSLKLDYEEVMNAWSDKGSFYINGGGGGDHFSSQLQIVPDILHLHDNVRGDSSGGSSLWRVPSSEEGSCSTAGMDAVDGASAGGGDVHDEYGDGMTTMMKMVEREARVLRYKEKRQSRLFSKRIRYQVRKLNAEKRPRLKGRFVKRD